MKPELSVKTEDNTSSPQRKPIFGLIHLNNGISKRNYVGSLIHASVIGFFLSGVELLQQNLLLSKDYYHFDPKEAIQYNALITFEDLFIKICVTPFYGIMVDKIGRQKSLMIGYFLITVALMLFPLRFYLPAFQHLGWYFGARFIYSNGSAIIPIIPLLADYVEDRSLGKAIGFNVFSMTVGFTASTTVIKTLEDQNLFYTCATFAAIIFIVGFTYTMLLKSGNTYYKRSHDPENTEQNYNRPSQGMINSSKMTKRSLIKHDCITKPWIMVAYIFAFLNGIGLAITSQLLNLYVQSFDDPNVKALGAITVFKANVTSTATSLVFGPLLDFIKPLYIALLTFLVTILAYSNAWTIKDPNDWPLTLIAIGVGMGYACTQLLTNYLGFKNYRRSIRGLLFALANIFIVSGVIFVSVIGGNLFRYFDRNWPFYIAAGSSVLGLFVFIYIYCKYIRKEEQEDKEGEKTPLLTPS